MYYGFHNNMYAVQFLNSNVSFRGIFSKFNFPALHPCTLISSIYEGVCTSQNGGDKGQHMATRGSRIREW